MEHHKKEAVSRLLLAALLAAGGPASALGADTTPTPTPASVPSPHPPASVVIWQTSFDCPDWTQFDYFAKSPGLRPCHGNAQIGQYGGWTVGGDAGRGTGTPDRLTTEANRPGSPGKGFRHYRGTGTNVNGGGIAISPGNLTEFWLRYYMRYQQGFAWLNGRPHYTKDWYVNIGGQNTFAIGFQGNGYGIHYAPRSQNYTSSVTWASLMGGPTGDGRWHCVELHLKNGPSGRVEMWINGQQVLNAAGDFGTVPWSYFVLGENQNKVRGGLWYTDFDDIVISTTGKVGCQVAEQRISRTYDCEIIGDGLTPETAFRPAIHDMMSRTRTVKPRSVLSQRAGEG